MLFNSIRGAPWELQPRAEGGVANGVQLDVQTAIPEREKPHSQQSGNSCQDERILGDQWTWRGTGTQMYRVPASEIGFKAGGSQRGMPCKDCQAHDPDDNLNQRVQIAQDRIVETTPSEARTGDRVPVPEPARKKVRFAERVEEQTLEGTVATNSRSTSSSSSSSSSTSSSDSSSSHTMIAPSMQVDESNQDSSKRQKVDHGADVELEGLVMESERARLQRYSDCDFLMRVKQNADVYLDRTFSNDRRKTEIVKKELIQLGVHPSLHVVEVFSSPRTARFLSEDLVSLLDSRLTCDQDGT